MKTSANQRTVSCSLRPICLQLNVFKQFLAQNHSLYFLFNFKICNVHLICIYDNDYNRLSKHTHADLLFTMMATWTRLASMQEVSLFICYRTSDFVFVNSCFLRVLYFRLCEGRPTGALNGLVCFGDWFLLDGDCFFGKRAETSCQLGEFTVWIYTHRIINNVA